MEEELKYTKYETARIIGARALQLSMGAPFILKLTNDELEKLSFDTIKIAKLEFDAGLIPITIKRPYPGVGKKETPIKHFDQIKLE